MEGPTADATYAAAERFIPWREGMKSWPRGRVHMHTDIDIHMHTEDRKIEKCLLESRWPKTIPHSLAVFQASGALRYPLFPAFFSIRFDRRRSPAAVLDL